jgi:alginate lyase
VRRLIVGMNRRQSDESLLNMPMSVRLLILFFILPPLCMAEEIPGKILDLSGWKLTLPIDTARPGRPDEILSAELASFQGTGLFYVSGASRGVVFRAPCGGIPTKGSSYPRCELREMAPGGTTEAAWGTDDQGRHSLAMMLAIAHTPAVKKHVVCAQIHDSKDDLLMIRLEGKKLRVERNSQDDMELDPNYHLGTTFTLKLQAGGGRIGVWYNDMPKLDWKVARTGCYFKAGCYTQSTPQTGDSPDDYGEVIIHELRVEHSP